MILHHVGHVRLIELFSGKLGELFLGCFVLRAGLGRQLHALLRSDLLQLFVCFLVVSHHALTELLYVRTGRFLLSKLSKFDFSHAALSGFFYEGLIGNFGASAALRIAASAAGRLLP